MPSGCTCGGLIALICVMGVQQAAAQAPPANVRACMDEHDAGKRLACYDREMARAVAGSATPPFAAPASAAATPAASPSAALPSTPRAAANPPPAASPAASSAPPPATANSFGMTEELRRKQGLAVSDKSEKLSAHVTAVSNDTHGEAIVTLDNGQVWEELEASSHLPLRPGDTVTLKHGMLGAFFMSSDRVLGLRVKRVR